MGITDRASGLQRVRRTARVRKSRGYNWEDTLAKRFNSADGWRGYRLGSASTSLPDILALNPVAKAAFVIEAKSGTADRLIVPAHQIERCIDWYHILGPFKRRRVVLAFKFLSKRRIGLDQYRGRELREFFKEWDIGMSPIECVCMYDGSTYGRCNDKRTTLDLRNCRLPAPRKRQEI